MLVLKLPSLRVTAWRSSGGCSMGMPKAAPMACASTITALQKPRTSGSSRIRSHGAPVSADTGFIVRLPHSLNHTSRWMRSDTVTASPAPRISAATFCSAASGAPTARPRIKPLPLMCRTRPGAGRVLVRCTTPPSTCRAGMAARATPPGSTLSRASPRQGPARPSKNHQGTPFIAVSTCVRGPINAATCGAAAASAGPFTASTTRS